MTKKYEERKATDHWCEKNLTEYQRAGVMQTQKLYFMYYRKPGMNPREAYNARMLEEYGHEQDEACEAWRQERIALSERLFPRGQQAAAEEAKAAEDGEMSAVRGA